MRRLLSRFPTSTLMGLAFTVPATLIAAILLMYHVATARRFVAEEGVRYGEILTDQLLSASQRFLRLGSMAAVQEMIEDTGSKRAVVHVALVDSDGRVIASSRRDWIGQEDTVISEPAYRRAAQAARATFQAQHRLVDDGKRIVLVAPLLVQGANPILLDSRGTLYLKVDQERKLAEIHALILRRGLVSAVGILAVSLLMLAWVRAILARPILAVAAFLRDFARGAAEVPPRLGGTREVAQLVEDVGRMAHDLRAQQAALAASEERHRKLLEGAHDAIFTVDPQTGVILEANAMFCRLFGRTSDELRGLSLTDLHPPEAAGRMLEAYHDAADLAQRDFHNVPCLRKEGSRFHADIRGGPIPLVGRTVTEWILRDTTERRRLEEQLRQSQRMESVGTLAGGMAHDFNNLLTGILGYTRLVKNRLKPGDANLRPLETIEKSSLRAADLTAQLQTFSRRAASRPVPVRLDEALAAPLTGLKGSIPPHIELLVRPGGSDLWTVAVDTGQIGQVLERLCANAVEAMPKGGRLVVAIANRTLDESDCRNNVEARQGRFVTLTVEDTGTGIDPALRGRVFEPFFTTKKAGEGVGLGLAMVYGAVKGHDGWVELQSEPGRGSRFIVYLPVWDAHAIEGRFAPPAALMAQLAGVSPAPPVPRAAAQPQGPPRTILAVDDESTILALARDILELHGYRVLTARGGEEALRAFRAGGVDLVLLDLTMPLMGGLDCMRAILKIDPGARIVISSGFSAENTVAEVMAAGALDYVQKPYDIEALARVVRGALEAPRRPARAAAAAP